MADIRQISDWRMSTANGMVYERLLGALGSEEFGATVRDSIMSVIGGVRRIYLFEATSREPEPVPPPSETTVLLVAALRRLPARQRQAFCLHHLLDLSIGDIARETGAAEGTVKSWLFRARSALAESLGSLSPRQEGTDVR